MAAQQPVPVTAPMSNQRATGQQQVVELSADQRAIGDSRWLWQHYTAAGKTCVCWHNSDWALPRRQCWDSFMLFLTQGNLQVITDGLVTTAGPGQVVLIPDGMQHAFIQTDPAGQPLTHISLHADIVNPWGSSALACCDRLVMDVPDWQHWQQRLQRIAATSQHDSASGQAALTRALPVFIDDLINGGLGINRDAAQHEPRIDQVLRLIHGDLRHDWSVPELAGAARLGVVQFRKLFKAATGHSPNKYLASKRLQAACHLLQFSSHSVKDIAHQVGYPSEYYFQRVFKQAYGATPTSFRQQHRL